MSYLAYPRLHFTGKFQADPSTVNNNADNFGESFQADYSKLTGKAGESWNPNGTGSWRFQDCVVTSAAYLDGTTTADSGEDAIIGMNIANRNLKVAGKIVDLDTQQQMVSEIWGFQLSLVTNNNTLCFTGDFLTTAFADVWLRKKTGPPVNANFGAFYQSVLNIIEWSNPVSSRWLTELAALYKKKPEKLSIKFNVDGHNSDKTTPDFTFGRVVGTIGFHQQDEPSHFVNGRMLIGQHKNLNAAYFKLVDDTIHFDFGNSFPTETAGGKFGDIGKVTIAIQSGSTSPATICQVDYLTEKFYTQDAGIFSIKLTPSQRKLALSNPLMVLSRKGNKAIVELTESEGGVFVRPDQFVFRMNPGDKKSAKLYAYRFGMPAKGEKIKLFIDIVAGMDPSSFPLNVPKSAFTIPGSISCDDKGTAVLPMIAKDPGCPRKYIDGQLYGIGYQIGDKNPTPGTTLFPITTLVYSDYKIPATPNWIEHVEPIFRQYANLYPVMKPIVDLGNFSSVLQKSYILKNVFDLPIEDPNYMPVTRDLSEAKRTMIKKWLDNPLYMNLDSVEDLKQALQLAIELEHSTIPPYLTALYSIKPGLNTEVSGLIRSVVLEEMLHMALVANILVSIGGSPDICHARFIPVYPSSLPGGLRFGLTVRLRKCSIQHIRECFMAIEEPDELIMVKRNQLRPKNQHSANKYTIAWLYDEIIKSLKQLHHSGELSFGNIDKQVKAWGGTGVLFPIATLGDAIKAIQEIKDQGEGTNLNPNDENEELAHYYKFSEIVEGRHLLSKAQGYSYTGAPIAFELEAVWPLVDDPHAAMYAKGSRAEVLNTQFTQTYRALLGALHKTFNGDPAYLKSAIGTMFSLETIALQLVKTPSGLNDGTTACPTFQI